MFSTFGNLNGFLLGIKLKNINKDMKNEHIHIIICFSYSLFIFLFKVIEHI